MDSKDKFINIKEKEKLSIQDKRRGDLLYYSVSQVATLLNEEESEIRYYTNNDSKIWMDELLYNLLINLSSDKENITKLKEVLEDKLTLINN